MIPRQSLRNKIFMGPYILFLRDFYLELSSSCLYKTLKTTSTLGLAKYFSYFTFVFLFDRGIGGQCHGEQLLQFEVGFE